MTIADELKALRAKRPDKNKPDNCPKCKSTDLKVGFMYDSLNRIRYPYYCVDCGYRTALYVKHDDIKFLSYTPVESKGDINQQRYAK